MIPTRSGCNIFVNNLDNYFPFSDVDECSDSTHTCGAGATCHNLDGTYSCECASGYAANPLFQSTNGADTVCDGKFLFW